MPIEISHIQEYTACIYGNKKSLHQNTWRSSSGLSLSSLSSIQLYRRPMTANLNAALQELHYANCSHLGLLATGTKADLIAQIQPLLAPASSTLTASSPGSNSITTTAYTTAPTTSFTSSLVSPSQLPPYLSNIGSPSTGPETASWLQSIATQAAKSAVQ